MDALLELLVAHPCGMTVNIDHSRIVLFLAAGNDAEGAVRLEDDRIDPIDGRMSGIAYGGAHFFFSDTLALKRFL